MYVYIPLMWMWNCYISNWHRHIQIYNHMGIIYHGYVWYLLCIYIYKQILWVYIYILYLSYGQNLVHGEGTSLSRVVPYQFCSGGTLYKPSWGCRFGSRFRVGPYRVCSNGNPTALSILLWSWLILSDAQYIDIYIYINKRFQSTEHLVITRKSIHHVIILKPRQLFTMPHGLLLLLFEALKLECRMAIQSKLQSSTRKKKRAMSTKLKIRA